MNNPIPVFVNVGGGTAAAKGDKLRDELEAAFGEAGATIDLALLKGGELSEALAAKAKEPLVVVGGGDGTLGCAAQALTDHGDATLGILPLGTHNHLAKELGIPLGLGEAAKLIVARPTRRIDLARVNGRVFVNNASVGFYPLMVRERDTHQEQHGVPKWLATLPAAREALRRLPQHRLRLELPGGPRDVTTPMLFVGNNRYRLDAGKLGRRDSLDAGVLSLFAVTATSSGALIAVALRALVGRADRSRDFAAIGEVRQFSVDNRSGDREIALDGEVIELDMPLAFSIEPGALEVVAPSKS
ncbi:MAG: diacylglycerol kinase family protein [Sphingomonas sp.]|jgi:diacylglycerol kinase family enzyme|uniref:diacylglycerol/lipid kinase family protein n=1 Tax=Sphingomonas sp. TaxID=28214 RepID=UPI003563E5AE